MRVLYAIQGTGNGHLSRAMEIIPYFAKRADVDVLLSGTQSDLTLPFQVRYRFHGLSFIFGKNGGIDLYATYASNRFRQFLQDVNNLPVQDYDLVVSDFEPISSWACLMAGKPCIGLSNQAALFTTGVPLADVTDPIGRFILSHYAPVTRSYGFHFQRYNSTITTPIIRQEVRKATVSDLGHYTVYLPAHDTEKITALLKNLPDTRWEVFSKHSQETSATSNIVVRPISGREFLKSMASSTGVLCAAGFGTSSEALFLRKKLCVIPMKGQFEQQCNAVALAEMGIPILPALKRKHLPKLENWIADSNKIRICYPDNADTVVGSILSDHFLGSSNYLEKKVLAGICA